MLFFSGKSVGNAAFLSAVLQLLISFSVLAAPPKQLEDDGTFGKHMHGLGGAAEEERKGKKEVIVFRGYSRHKDRFSRMCRDIGMDGRLDKMYQMMAVVTERDPDCIACSPFFKAMASSCKSFRVQKRDSRSGQNATLKKQRDPHAAVVDRASQVFLILADEKDIQFETLKAVGRFTDILDSPDGKTPAERDYFSVIAECARGSFAEVARKKAEKDRAEGIVSIKPAAPVVDVNALFD